MRAYVRRAARPLAVVMLLALLASGADAAPDAGTPGQEVCRSCRETQPQDGADARGFDPASATTLEGKVIDVRRLDSDRARGTRGVPSWAREGAPARR
jgi:hypothetical protein